jgi:hypothetical protein
MTDNQGKILAIVFLAVFSAGAIFFGLQYLSDWHEREIMSALELQRRQFEKSHAELESALHELEEQLDKERHGGIIPDERAEEVFGTAALEQTEVVDPCLVLEKRIASFFEYIDRQTGAPANASQKAFFQMMADLAETPPLVVGETRDLITLLRNRAHFFRVLRKERIDLVRGILKSEQDILESAMADFYAYYISENRCTAPEVDRFMPIASLYDYAGFFLETISGKSYLMRRSSVNRSLTTYYSVLVVDQAINEGINKYGIDIREHIELAKDSIYNQGGMANKDLYMKKLDELKRKYP